MSDVGKEMRAISDYFADAVGRDQLIRDLQRVVDLLCAKNNRLRVALKFYADENNYLPHEFYPDSSPVDIDRGKIACAALGEEAKGEKVDIVEEGLRKGVWG